ncbi:MAG: phosphate ABC transporter ATP-binding protein PstB [Coriobacteriales bacterium]|nr:phosphate ABC transporter ATP-binding protein PstB [Coriobacteriales bacterium]
MAASDTNVDKTGLQVVGNQTAMDADRSFPAAEVNPTVEGTDKVSIRNMDFFYGQKQVIFSLNLSVKTNQILAIIGPSNSGISTTLRSMNRLFELNPESRFQGDISIDGKSIFDESSSVTELRRRVGMVFDVPTPLPMSIFDNIAYGPRLSGLKNKRALQETVEEALRMAVLWDEVKDRLSTAAMSLSGGQQQRLCIARVLALKPEIILLDRPCSGLDPISTARIEESLIELKKQFTIVIAPHNVQQAVRISDRVAFMLMGKLIEEGASSEVFVSPKDQRTDDYITGRFG